MKMPGFSLCLKAQLLPRRSGSEEEITALPYNMEMNVLGFLSKPLWSHLFNLRSIVQLYWSVNGTKDLEFLTVVDPSC